MTTSFRTSSNFASQKLDRNMIDSVTNAIFQRAAAKSTTEDAVEKSSNTNFYSTGLFKTTVQKDMMSEARQSVKSANPFSNDILSSVNSSPAKEVVSSEAVSSLSSSAKTSSSQDIQKSEEPVFKAISNRAAISGRRRVSSDMALQNGMFAAAMRESMMVQAQDQMSRRGNLMYNLRFLNSQEALSAYPKKNFV